MSKRFRSKFEANVAKNMPTGTSYEPIKIKWTRPASVHTYNPDWQLPNGVLVETKGRWSAQDRARLLIIKQQFPALDIRMLFQRASNPINKGSATTYGMWCDKHGITWAEGTKIPEDWKQ